MASQFACQSCGINFDESETACVSEGSDVHYIGDSIYFEPIEYDACPYCLSISIDPIETDNE